MRASPVPLVCALLGLSNILFAGVKITGTTHYEFQAQNTTVTFGCEGLTNPSKENATGTLMLRLWALEAPYKGGTINGAVLASYKLNGLNPLASYNSLSENVKATMPSRRKSYILCLTALEFKDGKYVVSDYRNFKDSVTLGPPSLFTMSGPFRWQTSPEGGTIDIEVAKISHTHSGSTGTLKLAVWATSQPYQGGSISGYLLGYVKKEPLKPGYSYTNVKNTAKYTRPPPGTYYVSIVLSEFSDNEYGVVAHLNSMKTSTFK